ncbi:LacI family DNA-binding transcriptional regulator [Paraflavitalea pollutisoli]|uniref:LacI family DNA-binding transcriptional regulator n=1 Tax=Paraflavitalea pollutisoli TaxID=3034143 RepID=UPI0023EAE69A|nr:substrate-binding domain-containing protein [Paraflavitalea sp. H1-2-19X]
MIRCIKCNQVHAITKSGIVRGKQRYRCKDCNLFFTFPDKEGKPTPVRQQQAPTIRDIATELNISKSTVSRALQAHSDINEHTRNAVIDMARKLNYHPNLLAKSLVNKKSNTIGIIVPEFVNYFFPTLIIGAQEVAARAGYNVIICQSQESAKTEVANVNVLLSSRVEGVIVSMTKETKQYDHFRTFEKLSIPMVFFNRICEPLDTSRVTVNDYEGAFKGVEHLIKNGFTKIAHIAGPGNLLLSHNRLKGYQDALKKYRMPINDKYIIPYNLTDSHARKCAQKLLQLRDRPDAIFCLNDVCTTQALLVAKEMGIAVPQELGIVGFGNNPLSAYIEPSLTTIEQPVHEMGRVAMDILIDHITKGYGQYTPVHRTLATKLVVRASSVK